MDYIKGKRDKETEKDKRNRRGNHTIILLLVDIMMGFPHKYCFTCLLPRFDAPGRVSGNNLLTTPTRISYHKVKLPSFIFQIHVRSIFQLQRRCPIIPGETDSEKIATKSENSSSTKISAHRLPYL
jgi:hypothetical protein